MGKLMPINHIEKSKQGIVGRHRSGLQLSQNVSNVYRYMLGLHVSKWLRRVQFALMLGVRLWFKHDTIYTGISFPVESNVRHDSDL